MTEEENTPVDETTPEHTLAEQGPVLPIGIPEGDQLHRALEIRPWRLKEEREIGELRAKSKKKNQFEFASLMLATMVTKMGQADFAAMKKMAHRELVIQGMYLADVLYSYLWLRCQSLGSLLDLTLDCPDCRESYVFKADLDSVPVKTCKSIAETLWDYELKSPFTIRGKEVKVLTFGPAKWNTFSGKKVEAHVKVQLILKAIVKVDGKETPLSPTELDEMTKLDLESILAEIEDRHIGPDMSIEAICPHCDFSHKTEIDWYNDSFFGVSGSK